MDEEFLDISSDSCSILIVGDGDFSFSVAFTTKYEHLTVTATTLEQEELMKTKYPDFLDNISHLREKGVSVITGIDATALHNSFQDTKFSHVIFNFPHVGGKSNIKKNRQLLDEFFKSAERRITDDGAILVALCKGQGGTAADKPQRDWCNSWQASSKAANSGLILTSVYPFAGKAIFKDYLSTGFRSQNKMFHTEGSLVHKFVKSSFPLQPGSVPESVRQTESWHTKDCLLNSLVDALCQCLHTTLVDVDQPSLLTYSDNYCTESVILAPNSDVLKYADIQIGDDLQLRVDDSSVYLEDKRCGTAQRYQVGNFTLDGLLVISMKTILSALFYVKDVRYFVNNHLNLGSITLLNEKTIAVAKGKPGSIYPPEYDFDISFWITKNYSTADFIRLAYHISNHLMREIKLIDAFTHPETHLTSHCYRVTYQSLNKPLPYCHAYLYYQHLREELTSKLHVTLR